MPFELNLNPLACHTIKFHTRWAVVVIFIAGYYKNIKMLLIVKQKLFSFWIELLFCVRLIKICRPA